MDEPKKVLTHKFDLMPVLLNIWVNLQYSDSYRSNAMAEETAEDSDRMSLLQERHGFLK